MYISGYQVIVVITLLYYYTKYNNIQLDEFCKDFSKYFDFFGNQGRERKRKGLTNLASLRAMVKGSAPLREQGTVQLCSCIRLAQSPLTDYFLTKIV